MLDLKFIRDNAETVKQAVSNKNAAADVDRILALDEAKRTKQYEFDQVRAQQKIKSKEIGSRKKQGLEVESVMEEVSAMAEAIKQLGAELGEITNELDALLLTVPNLPQEDVPVGGEENNAFIREWCDKREFAFEPREHQEICGDTLDFKRGAKITGSGFPLYRGNAALLERALINYFLDKHVLKHGYTEMKPPFIVNRKTMTGTGQLPKLEEDMYRIETEDFFLIPTAEVPVTNFHAEEILGENDLPVKYCAYTPCFRREAGSYGKETRGLHRVHQFNKVELVQLTCPEDSAEALESITASAEAIVQELRLHYRVMKLATGDLSFASAITYDIEVWAPGAKRYLEVSSISNFKDFQARRASIRYRRNDDNKVDFVHTLNGSGLATPRIFVAVVETWQNEDGSITVPPCLRPYLQNRERLEF